MNEKLRALIEAFCADALPQAVNIETLQRTLNSPSEARNEVLGRMRSAIHRMAGTTRSMGFEELGASLVGLELRVRACLEDPGTFAGARDEIAARVSAVVCACALLRPEASGLWSSPVRDPTLAGH